MPQEMNVLRCYSCQMFQVHIVKKLKKWQCKICNEKQSIKNVFYQGSGQDCRIQVQYLNFTEHTKKPNSSEFLKTADDAEKSVIRTSSSSAERPAVVNSKWTKYLDAYEEECDQDIDQSPDCEIVLPDANLTSGDNSFHEGFVDQEETNSSLSDSNYVNELSTAEVSSNRNEGVSRFGEGIGHPSNIIVHSNFENVPSVGVKRVREKGDDCSLLSGGCFSPGPSGEDGETTFLPKHTEKKYHSEKVQSQYEPKMPGKTFGEQTKLDNECSFMQKRLREIVARNRAKIGRSTEKLLDKSSMVENGERVATEIDRWHNLNQYPDISETSGKKRNIFESDCTEFDEIADLL